MTDPFEIGRLVYALLSVYGLWVLVTRWRVSRVLTRDRRYLFLFFVLELLAAAYSGLYKFVADSPGDASVFLTILTQFFLAAYLHTSVPRERRRPFRRSPT